MTSRIIWRVRRLSWTRCFTSRPVADEPVGHSQIIVQDGTLQRHEQTLDASEDPQLTEYYQVLHKDTNSREIDPVILHSPADTTSPQLATYYQMLFKTTSSQDIRRIISHSPADAAFVEMTWNALKTSPNGYSASRCAFEELVQKTIDVMDDLTEAGFAIVWTALARLSLLHPTLKAKMTEKALGPSGDAAYLSRFSPRHLLNVLHSVARVHRVAKTRKLLSIKGEAFPRESALLKVLFRESFRRLNETNEYDLSALSLSMSILDVADGNMYRRLGEEAEKDIHLKRFTNWELANVAYALTQGGGVDLWNATPRIAQEMLNPERHDVGPPRILAFYLRCLSETKDREKHARQLMPLFRILFDEHVLSLMHPTAVRSTIVGLGYFRINNRGFWTNASTYLLQTDPWRFTNFDWTCILYAMGIVRYYHRELLDKIAAYLMEKPASIIAMRRMGLSNCFFAVGSLKYKNKTFVSALCNALVRDREKPRDLTPPQITNMIFSLAQIAFRHDPVVHYLIEKAMESLSEFTNHTLVLFFFGLSLDMYHGDVEQIMGLVEDVFSDKRLQAYSNNELGMVLCALGKLRPPIGHRFPTLLEEIQKERRCTTYQMADLVRIVKAFVDLRHPIPIKIKEHLLQCLEKMETLQNRSFLDFLHCLETMEGEMEKGEKMEELKTRLGEALTDARLDGFRSEELSECITAIANLSMMPQTSIPATLLEELLERVILLGSFSHLSGTALHFSLSALNRTERHENRPLLYSLAVECSRPSRLKIYDAQQMTGIFYHLTLLRTLHRTAFDAFVEEMVLPERLDRYREHHVVKILKGLSIGKHKNELIVGTLLNAFLHPKVTLSPVNTAYMLLNLALLNCWKRPYVDLLMQQVSKETSLDHYGLWEIGVIAYVMGRMKHGDRTVLVLLCQQMTTERLVDASNTDLCNLVFGLAHLHHKDEAVVMPLLSEVLKNARCENYSNRHLVRFLQSFAEWQIVDPCQFAGLSEQMRKQERLRSMRSLHLLVVLKALARLRLFHGDIVDGILNELRMSSSRMADLTAYEMQELRFLAGMAKPSVSAAFQPPPDVHPDEETTSSHKIL